MSSKEPDATSKGIATRERYHANKAAERPRDEEHGSGGLGIHLEPLDRCPAQQGDGNRLIRQRDQEGDGAVVPPRSTDGPRGGGRIGRPASCPPQVQGDDDGGDEGFPERDDGLREPQELPSSRALRSRRRGNEQDQPIDPHGATAQDARPVGRVSSPRRQVPGGGHQHRQGIRFTVAAQEILDCGAHQSGHGLLVHRHAEPDHGDVVAETAKGETGHGLARMVAIGRYPKGTVAP